MTTETTPSPQQATVLARAARASVFQRVGPGIISGAADDDPGGIATYSQAGAQFGVDILGSIVFTYPLLAAIQSISARIGRVTGRGLAANMARVFPRPVLFVIIGLLFVANAVNIGADLAAMGAAARLVTGWNAHAMTIGFAAASLGLQIFVPYHIYVRYLKWLTLALFAYVGVLFAVKIDWADTLLRTFAPHLEITGALVTTIVAIFGTTISPYLMFWQASEEVEEAEVDPDAGPLLEKPEQAPAELSRIDWDTYLGMGFAHLIAFFIVLTTAVTLHAAGRTDIQTSAEAAEALRPIAGEFAFLLFTLGIIGTGLLAVPVLAGSVAYAIGEAAGWRVGLERQWRDARGFYAILTLATLIGLGIGYTPIDPIKALFWSAVLNGLIAVPIMAAMMIIVSRRQEMGAFIATRWQRFFGWFATAVMAVAAIIMVVLSVLSPTG